jgi:hypothetical protein
MRKKTTGFIHSFPYHDHPEMQLQEVKKLLFRKIKEFLPLFFFLNHFKIKKIEGSFYSFSGRKNADKHKCKIELSLISRNKRRNDVNLAGNKPKEVKKMRLSQAESCVEDGDVSKSNNHGPSNLNFLKETTDIQELCNTQECKIKRGEDNFQRKFPARILRNSKLCGKEILAEVKEDVPHILTNSKQLPEEHLQKNKGGSVRIATRSSRQKRVRDHDLDNTKNRGASRSIQPMHPAEESEKWSIEGMEEHRYGLGGTNCEADRPKIVGKAIDGISATEEVAQDCSSVLDIENMKFDPTSKWCLIRTDPSETGGRRMRPRPLSLEQPLLVLIEGQDQVNRSKLHYHLQILPFWDMFMT